MDFWAFYVFLGFSGVLLGYWARHEYVHHSTPLILRHLVPSRRPRCYRSHGYYRAGMIGKTFVINVRQHDPNGTFVHFMKAGKDLKDWRCYYMRGGHRNPERKLMRPVSGGRLG